jgi:hypothetical protein
MHTSEFMHCSSSYSNCTNQTCTLRQRRWTSSFCTLQTCGKWKKLAKLPIENEISKSQLLLTNSINVNCSAPALGAVSARVPGWALIGAWKHRCRTRPTRDWRLDTAVPKSKQREGAGSSLHEHTQVWPVKAPAPTSCTWELRTATERKEQTQVTTKNSTETWPNQKR